MYFTSDCSSHSSVMVAHMNPGVVCVASPEAQRYSLLLGRTCSLINWLNLTVSSRHTWIFFVTRRRGTIHKQVRIPSVSTREFHHSTQDIDTVDLCEELQEINAVFLVPTLLSLGVKSLEDLQVLGGMCVTPQYGDLVRQAIGLMEGPDWAILGHTLRWLANLVGHITYMASPQALSQSHEGRSTCPLTHCPSCCSFSRLRSHRHPGINSEFF